MPFRVNKNGVLIQTPQIDLNPKVNAYKAPSKSLKRLDQLMKGRSPSILVSRKQGGIGDVLMTLPVVKALHRRYRGKVGIDYATDVDYLNGALPKVLWDNPYIKNILDYRDVSDIEENYDAYIELTCPCIAHEVPRAAPVNRIDLFARHAGVPLLDTSMDYYLRDKEIQWVSDFLTERQVPHDWKIVVVQANSSTRRRDLPIEKLKSAVGKFTKRSPKTAVVVVTHSNNRNDIQWKMTNVIEMRDYDVRFIAAMVNRADLVICPDSAILHIASALHKKTLTLFGPTDPRARVNYHPEAVAIWYGTGMQCAPCWYSPDCPGGFACWNMIKDDFIVDIAFDMLREQSLPNLPELISFPKKDNQIITQDDFVLESV